MNGSSTVIFNITKNVTCESEMKFIWNVLGICVMDSKLLFSVIFGLLSIVAWMIYGIPQMILNCKKGIPDEAMSPFLLIFWTIGDTCNMVGALLTNQLVLQVAMAAYAIFCDLILDFQYFYAVIRRYLKKRSRQGPQDSLYSDNSNYIDSVSVEASRPNAKRAKLADQDLSETSSIQSSYGPSRTTGGTALFCLGMFACMGLVGRYSPIEQTQLGGSRKLFSLEEAYEPVRLLKNGKEVVGYVLGCLSSLFYCSGRIPQIYMNFKRRCTDGLSPSLFLFAMLGNLFYGAQILLMSVDRLFILHHLPWIIGSWGVMLLDSVILLQFIIFRRNVPMTYEVLSSEDEDEPMESEHRQASDVPDRLILVP